MSLSSLIDEEAEIRAGFRARIVKPTVRLDYSIKAPPLTSNYGIVGTAFDYLLRFHVQRINSFARASVWVAESGLEFIGATEHTYDLDRGTLISKSTRKRRKAETFLYDAKEQHQSYLQNGVATRELLSSVLRLAYLDLAYRVGPERIDWEAVKSPHSKDIEDLAQIFSRVDANTFKASHTCILNPNFGAASSLVGGADADILLDNCLIDIKTTKHLRLEPRDLYRWILPIAWIRRRSLRRGENKLPRNSLAWPLFRSVWLLVADTSGRGNNKGITIRNDRMVC